ncbi:hypothetical protein D3C72_1527940 [compost metagenome]
MAPDLGHLRQVQFHLLLALHQREAFGVGLHHSVLDAVVNHLGEVACAGRADARPAAVLGRCQRAQQRCDLFDHRGIATHHQAVAFLQAPHAAAGAAVHVAQVIFGQRLGATDRVLVVGVATVDDDVTFGQVRGQLAQRLVHGLAGRHHQPHHARHRQRGHCGGQRIHHLQAGLGGALAGALARVVADHAVATAVQALGHVGAHAAEADHCNIHCFTFSWGLGSGCLACRWLRSGATAPRANAGRAWYADCATPGRWKTAYADCGRAGG